ncbi:MAG: M23 family metallopeptidase [Bryobacterales bacterium]|nr:M23 family metallopeptidase [Bryobacterales bacterium]
MPALRRLTAICIILFAGVALSPLDAAGAALKKASRKKSKTHRKRRPRHRLPSDRVAPSQAIEQRVGNQIRLGRQILENLSAANLLENPYVVSAVFYHDGFLESFPSGREDADPGRRILAELVRILDFGHKTLFISLLNQSWQQMALTDRATALAAPVVEGEPGRRRRRGTHKHAIDLFAAEGTPVRSASDGLVVLAEGGWSAVDPFSTSSRRGGNSIIVFDPWLERFYRYCHLESVNVSGGAVVRAGDVIGAVGHTGLNASQPGHGHHLHFEINQYDGSSVRPLDAKALRKVLRESVNQTPSRAPLFLPPD